MTASKEKEIQPFNRFQKIRHLSFYPILAIMGLLYVVKIDHLEVDWRLLPLVLFIIAGVVYAIGIAYYHKNKDAGEIKRSTAMRKMKYYFLSTADVVFLIGTWFMFDMLSVY